MFFLVTWKNGRWKILSSLDSWCIYYWLPLCPLMPHFRAGERTQGCRLIFTSATSTFIWNNWNSFVDVFASLTRRRMRFLSLLALLLSQLKRFLFPCCRKSSFSVSLSLDLMKSGCHQIDRWTHFIEIIPVGIEELDHESKHSRARRAPVINISEHAPQPNCKWTSGFVSPNFPEPSPSLSPPCCLSHSIRPILLQHIDLSLCLQSRFRLNYHQPGTSLLFALVSLLPRRG